MTALTSLVLLISAADKGKIVHFVVQAWNLVVMCFIPEDENLDIVPRSQHAFLAAIFENGRQLKSIFCKYLRKYQYFKNTMWSKVVDNWISNNFCRKTFPEKMKTKYPTAVVTYEVPVVIL